MRHILAIDFESWVFSQDLQRKKVPPAVLKKLDNGYSPYALEKTLQLLKKYNQKVTFFVIFQLEEFYPGLMRKILADGHEIGWHTYSHPFISDTGTLKKELEKSKKWLKTYRVKGFQAPAIIFIREGYKMLKAFHFEYSSSVYGNPNHPYLIDGVTEIPVSVSKGKWHPKARDLHFPVNMSVKNMSQFGMPFGSSYFWSILGKNYYDRKLKQAEAHHSIVNLFIHNWQLFPAPKITGGDIPDQQKSFFVDPMGSPYRKNVLPMMEFLLSNFRFCRMADYVSKRI